MEENKKETKQEEKVEEKKATGASVATESKKEEKKEETKKEAPKKEETKKETAKEDKKFDTVKGKVQVENKNNNTIVVIGIIAVIAAIIVIVIAMTVGRNTPKSVVESTLKEIKTGAFAQNMLAGLMQGENDTMDAETQKLLVEKLEWKVIEEKEEGETATVKVEITNKDFKTVMGNCMQKVLKATIRGNVNNQEMTNYLMEELRNEEIQTVTETNEVSLQKKDGKWEITEDENFVYAVLPGLQEAIEALR